jgi:ABC-type glycerol-3-phosphate transport system permease component
VVEKELNQKTEERLSHAISYIILSVILFWVVFPIFMLVSASFMSQADQRLSVPLILPTSINLFGWKYLLYNANILRPLENSIGIASITTLIVVSLTILSGYALARFEFKGKAAAFNMLLLTQFVPSLANLVSLYVIFSDLHVIDTWGTLIILYSTGGLVLGTLLFSGFFNGLPRNLEEAAMVDGTSRLGGFLRVVLPLARPGIIVVAVFTWLACWGEIQAATIFTTTDAARTLPVVLSQFQTPYGTLNFSAEFALGTILAVPPIVIFLIFQKYFKPTVATGGFKG